MLEIDWLKALHTCTCTHLHSTTILWHSRTSSVTVWVKKCLVCSLVQVRYNENISKETQHTSSNHQPRRKHFLFSYLQLQKTLVRLKTQHSSRNHQPWILLLICTANEYLSISNSFFRLNADAASLQGPGFESLVET